jgi:hypothetical protein
MQEREFESDDLAGRESDGLSRGALLMRAGAGIAAAGIVAPSTARALGKQGVIARKPPLTPHRAALEIRRVLTGAKRYDLSDPHLRIWDVDRFLADPRRGAATIELLRRQPRPRGSSAHTARAVAASIPQDRISAARFWWGYSVYFPHTPLIETVVELITNKQYGQLAAELSLVMNLVDLGWVVTALKAYLIGEITLLVYLDQKNNDGGAQLNATWASPLIYVPTEMK